MLNLFVAFFCGSIAIILVILHLTRKIIISRIYACLNKKEFSACNKIIDAVYCKTAFSPFQYIMLRMNIALVADSDEQVRACINKLDFALLNDGKKANVLYLAMIYYVNKQNKEMTEKIIAESEKLKDKNLFNEAEKLYHIFVLKDGSYVEEFEKKFKKTESSEKRKELASYLKIQYENTGDKLHADKYAKILVQEKKEELQ